ncbi:MAG: hypothetical protein Q9174_000161 [Haloplaca sp. 1 TL-2023]
MADPPPATDGLRNRFVPGGFGEDASSDHQQTHDPPNDRRAPRPDRHYPPRQCRICLEVVLPAFHAPSENIPNILQGQPFVTYESSDPETGRLLRPCKCRGSSKYVHEGCLQQWRHADPGYGRRNYWQCPTCGFQYRLERMQWGRWISSATTQITLTVSIMFLAIFLAGFIGDVIINFYLDPYWFISTKPWANFEAKFDPIMLDEEDPATWTEHFLKGFASVGLIGFAKAVYKGVRAWTRRTLEKAGERVMDEGRDDDDEDDNDPANGPNEQRSTEAGPSETDI